MCEKMLDEENISYEKLQVEQYVTDLHDYGKIIKLFSNWIQSAFCIYGEVCLLGQRLPYYACLLAFCLILSCRQKFRYNGVKEWQHPWLIKTGFLFVRLYVS